MLQKNWQELIKPSKIEFTPGNDKLRDATLVVDHWREASVKH